MERFTYTPGPVATPNFSGVVDAIKARSALAVGIAKQVHGFTQNLEDMAATKKGSQDASAAGAKWQPMSNLTEAGRAYNKSGQGIAQHMLAAEVSQNLNSIYTQVRTQPVSTDPTTGTQATYTKLAHDYYAGLKSKTAPALQPALQTMFTTQTANHSSHLTDQVAAYQVNQNQAQINSSATANSNSASNLMYTASSLPDGPAKELAMKGALDAHNQAQGSFLSASGSLAGESPAQALLKMQHANTELADSFVLGTANQFTTNYQAATDPLKKEQILGQMQAFTENFMDSKNPQLKKLLNTSLSPANKLTLQHNLRAQFRQMQLGHAATSNSNGAILAKNLQIQAATNGKYDANQFATYAAAHPTKALGLQDTLEGTKFAYSVANSTIAGGANSIKQMQHNIADSSWLPDIPGADENTRAIAKQGIKQRLAVYHQKQLDDPALLAQDNPVFKQLVTTLSNSALPKTVGTIDASQKVQRDIHNIQSNPSALLNQQLSNQYTGVIGQLNDQLIATQLQQGVSPGNAQLYSQDQAHTMISNLPLDPHDRIMSLLQLQANVGDKWGYAQRSLVKAGLPYGTVIAMGLYGRPQSKPLAEDLVRASEAKVTYEKAGTSAKGVRDALSSEHGYQNVRSQILGNHSLNAPEANRMISGLTNSIGQLASYRGVTTNKLGNMPSILAQSAEDVVSGLYQEGGKTPFLIPHSVMAGTSKVELDVPSLERASSVFMGEVGNQADLTSYGTTDQDRAMRLNDIKQGKWITTANGNGAVLVGRNGKPVFFKNGKPYSFSFAQAMTHPPVPSTKENYDLDIGKMQLGARVEGAV